MITIKVSYFVRETNSNRILEEREETITEAELLELAREKAAKKGNIAEGDRACDYNILKIVGMKNSQVVLPESFSLLSPSEAQDKFVELIEMAHLLHANGIKEVNREKGEVNKILYAKKQNIILATIFDRALNKLIKMLG